MQKHSEATARPLELIQHSSESWSLGKYYIYFDIDDLGFNDYTVLYKDHGVQMVAGTLEEAVAGINMLEDTS